MENRSNVTEFVLSGLSQNPKMQKILLVVFLIVKLILWVLMMILDVITRLPVIKSLNNLMGGIWGAASGVITVYLLLALLTFVTAVNSENAVVKNVLESEIASKMYNENFIVNIITPDEKISEGT